MLNKFNIPIYKALLLILGVIVLGVGGFMVIEGYGFIDALYMTIITVSTVGFMEVHPLSEAGRIFTTILIVTNIGIFTFAITRVTTYLLDGNFIKRYRRKKMKQQIARLQGHVIICGFGRNGTESAHILQKFGLPFVIIEKNPEIIESILGQMLYVAEDATKDDALKDAGIERARALITTLPDDAENVFVVLTARELRKNMTIISRATQPGSVKKLKIAGATNVIMPDRISGAYMATLVVNPDIMEFLDILSTNMESQGHIEELDLSRSTLHFTNRSIGEMSLKTHTGVNVVGIKKKDGTYIVNPEDDYIPEEGQKLILLGTDTQFRNFHTFLEKKV